MLSIHDQFKLADLLDIDPLLWTDEQYRRVVELTRLRDADDGAQFTDDYQY